MPAGKTYIKIASQTLSGSVSSVTFSNLPQNYTDLLIIGSVISSSTSNDTRVQFNGDTGSNYSMTRMYGEASSAGSDRSSNATSMHLGRNSTTVTPNTFHIMNYSNGSTFKTALGRSGFATGIVLANVGLWRSTAAITSITFLVTGGDTFSSGSTFTIYGIECAKNPYATGGDKVYTTGTHWVHEFYNSGLFVPRQNLTADYLVVAGGGGAGGGGGGAGGLRSTVTATGGGGSLESALSLTGNTGYTVTVGAGGAGTIHTYTTAGNNGSNSVFSTVTSIGGGYGAPGSAGGLTGNGGSGGGSVWYGTGGTGTANQGYAGGSGRGTGPIYSNGGGGGAGAVGQQGNSSANGNGGNGVASSITGSSITYAGGGGAANFGGDTPGTGGTGGGGNGANGTGANGSTNLGGGGGGGGGGNSGTGGNGGSGIVIVRYPV